MNKIVISHPLYHVGMEMLEGKAELIVPNNGDSDQIIDVLRDAATVAAVLPSAAFSTLAAIAVPASPSIMAEARAMHRHFLAMFFLIISPFLFYL